MLYLLIYFIGIIVCFHVMLISGYSIRFDSLGLLIFLSTIWPVTILMLAAFSIVVLVEEPVYVVKHKLYEVFEKYGDFWNKLGRR